MTEFTTYEFSLAPLWFQSTKLIDQLQYKTMTQSHTHTQAKVASVPIQPLSAEKQPE